MDDVGKGSNGKNSQLSVIIQRCNSLLWFSKMEHLNTVNPAGIKTKTEWR